MEIGLSTMNFFQQKFLLSMEIFDFFFIEMTHAGNPKSFQLLTRNQNILIWVCCLLGHVVRLPLVPILLSGLGSPGSPAALSPMLHCLLSPRVIWPESWPTGGRGGMRDTNCSSYETAFWNEIFRVSAKIGGCGVELWNAPQNCEIS